ncbi:inactive serine/threonine-protein kinase TEX14 [Leptodactylus fuscus]|uniref:inactive serine/threonine-protein kinase TEX14 n=1 Tax=Leptodactylus fuscus TaxID=238119 RepID=UPI003F4EE5DB
MSFAKITLPPYPVRIGSVKHCSPDKHLQDYVQCGNFAKVKKMLKKGIFPDTTNSQGQTPLFVAALLGLRKIVELLLNFGSNPNHRCLDWSTPVHAAAFSCDQWIMSRLLDAGGDLRLHDHKSQRPCDWSLMAGKEESAKMIEFIDRCTVHMQALLHFYPLKPMKMNSLCDPINSASFIDLFSPRNASRAISNPIRSENVSVKKTFSFGYGQFCVRDNGLAGSLLTFPFIEDKSLVRDESKPTFSYAAGPLMTMINLLWGSTEVTVKGLSDTANNEFFADLLIAEEEKMSYLQHPLILQLLALSTSLSLERKQLVFERVTFGSFYNILHERRSEYPILHLGTIVHILLQMIEALVFLHWRGFVHRSFSSHAIQIVSAGRAKISNFEYMIESKDNKKCDGIIHFPIPKQLYCWSSPEVVAGKAGSIKSDLYSFCAVMQESLTDSLPWNGLDGDAVKDSMKSGHYLTADPTLPEPYYSIVSTGIQANPEQRTTQLQDIGYLLKNDIKPFRGGLISVLQFIVQLQNPSMLELKNFLDKVPCTEHAPMVVEAGRDMKVYCTGQQILPDTFEAITDLSYKEKVNSSYSSSKTLSSVESQTETLCDMVEQTDEMNAYLHPLEKTGQNRARDFYQPNTGSPSMSLAVLSDSETGTSWDSEEEDDDIRSSETEENWQAELLKLDNRLHSIQINTKSSLDNLLYIQKFLQGDDTVLGAEEGQNQSKNTCRTENDFPPKGIDETDHVLPLFKSKYYVGGSAKGPPPHYIPPGGASYSRTDISSQIRRIQSKIVVDKVQKATKKAEQCPDLFSFKGNTHEKASTGQDFMQLTKRSSQNSQADDNDTMRHQ